MDDTKKKILWEKAEDECYNRYTTYCPCGRILTGFHGTYCSKFRKVVDKRFKELCREAEDES